VKLTWETMRALMAEALDEARRGLAEADLPVGAVLADGNGTIVGRGRSRTETTREFLAHGEMQAFSEISGSFSIDKRELILVTTLEPCMMCFGAAMGARVDTIIYALKAPSNGGVARCRPMQSPGMIMPRVVGGVCADKSLALFEEWNRRHPDRPFVKDLLEKSSLTSMRSMC
jgi:tRNA(adenine34) deaminase